MTPRLAAITLNLIPTLGSIRICRLLDFFGSPELILHADETMLRQVRGIGPELAAAIRSWKTTVNAEKELELADKAGASVTTIFDDTYPAPLRELPDPPIVLYHHGQWFPSDGERSVAIVGSRQATPYGRLTTRKFASELAECGVTIISGLAKGIDTEAHNAALVTGGRTIAIIGSGLNRLYPVENAPLAARISDGRGAVVSEFPMNMGPSRTTFPMRNRIVSGWSKATLVVEAPARSGALITAHTANEQGRLVYAVPGPVDRTSSDGCHSLIREGAILATCARHIIDDFHWADTSPAQQELALFPSEEPTPSVSSRAHSLSEQEQQVLHSINMGFRDLNTLCSSTGLTNGELTTALVRLQMQRLILPEPGGLFRPADS